MNTRGVAAKLAGDPRWSGADQGVRRERPRRGVRRRGAVRTRRLRGAATHGRPRRGAPRGARRGAAGAPAPAGAARDGGAALAAASATGSDGTGRSDVARGLTVPDAAVLGRPDRQGRPARRLRRVPRRAGDVRRPVGVARLPGRPGPERTRNSWRARAGRGCGCGWTASRPRACSRPPSSTATTRASARATTSSSCTTRGSGGEPGTDRVRFTFPRQRRDRRLCLADFFRSRDEADGSGSGRRRVPARHDGSAGRRGDRGAVREERLPRLPGAARALRAAHGGARRVLARAGS